MLLPHINTKDLDDLITRFEDRKMLIILYESFI
jgi:hypothetical protein